MAQDASTQQPMSIDQEIQMLRRDLRSQRKQLVAANMNLTEAEAVKFWPIYERYTAELVKGNNAKYEVFKEIAQTETLTDDQADSLTKRWLGVNESIAQLRVKYLPIFRSSLSAKRTALLFSNRTSRSDDDRSAAGKLIPAD